MKISNMRAIKLTCVVFLLLFSFQPVYPQTGLDSLLNIRKSHYDDYLLIRDTMTIRTWINMRYYSESLEEVTRTDNLIIDTLLTDLQKNRLLLIQTGDSLTNLLETEIDNSVQIKSRSDDLNYQTKFLTFILVIIFILLMVFIILTFVYIVKFRRWRARSATTEEDVKKIEREKGLLDSQIKTLTTKEIEIESKIEQYNKQNEKFSEEISDLEQEYEETKKLYNQELAYRKTLEDELRTLLEQLRISK